MAVVTRAAGGTGRPGNKQRSAGWSTRVSQGADPGSAALTLNRQFFWQIYVEAPESFDRVGIYAAAIVAASSVRLGVYADSNGAPGGLLFDWGTVDTTTTGEKTITITWKPARGVYWLSAAAQGTNAANTNRLRPNDPVPSTSAEFMANYGYADGVTGAFADPAPAVSYNLTAGPVPAAMLRAA